MVQVTVKTAKDSCKVKTYMRLPWVAESWHCVMNWKSSTLEMSSWRKPWFSIANRSSCCRSPCCPSKAWRPQQRPQRPEGRYTVQTACPHILSLMSNSRAPSTPPPSFHVIYWFSPLVSDMSHELKTLQKTGISDIWGIWCLLNWEI